MCVSVCVMCDVVMCLRGAGWVRRYIKYADGGSVGSACLLQPPPYVPKDEDLVENFPAAHIMPGSPLAECLIAHANAREPCRAELDAHRAAGLHSVQLSWRRHMVVLVATLWRLLQCDSFLPLTAVASGALGLWLGRRQAWAAVHAVANACCSPPVHEL